MLNRYSTFIITDCAFAAWIGLAMVTSNALADSNQPLPEVIEKESARMREVVIPGAPYKPHASTVTAQSKTDTSKKNTSSIISVVPQKNAGKVLFSDEQDIEVRGILEQVSKEKEILPGIVSSGGPVGMPQAQPMYQPEGQ